MPNSFLEAAQNVLTRGIDAYSEVQRARYSVNDPTPNNRGGSSTTTREGQPNESGALDATIRDTFSDPKNLMLIGAAVLLVVLLVRR